ncbi:MAG: nucleotidyltransferase domain-containing protein [Exilispira sp.]
MSDTLFDILKDIAFSIKQNFKSKKMILFGSYANAKPAKDSDIDLFIIMETDKRFPEEGARLKSFIRKNFKIDKPMGIIVRDKKFIEKHLKENDFFIKDIIEKAIEL